MRRQRLVSLCSDQKTSLSIVHPKLWVVLDENVDKVLDKVLEKVLDDNEEVRWAEGVGGADNIQPDRHAND